MKYQLPYTITPAIVNLVAETGETIGRYTVLAELNLTPREGRVHAHATHARCNLRILCVKHHNPNSAFTFSKLRSRNSSNPRPFFI